MHMVVRSQSPRDIVELATNVLYTPLYASLGNIRYDLYWDTRDYFYIDAVDRLETILQLLYHSE